MLTAVGETLWSNTGMMECGVGGSQGHGRGPPTHLCPVFLALDPIVTFRIRGRLVKTQDSCLSYPAPRMPGHHRYRLLRQCFFLSQEFDKFLLILSSSSPE